MKETISKETTSKSGAVSNGVLGNSARWMLGEFSLAEWMEKKPAIVWFLISINIITFVLACFSLFYASNANNIQRGQATASMLITFSTQETLEGFTAINQATTVVPREVKEYKELQIAVYDVRRKLEAFALCAKLEACDVSSTQDFICPRIKALESAMANAANSTGQKYKNTTDYHGYIEICLGR